MDRNKAKDIIIDKVKSLPTLPTVIQRLLSGTPGGAEIDHALVKDLDIIEKAAMDEAETVRRIQVFPKGHRVRIF